MHIIVSWDINAPASENYNYWSQKLIDVLKPYSWVRPLNTFYIVPVPNSQTVVWINAALSQVANQANGAIHIVISPPMAGGQYVGVLPTEMWTEINRRSSM